MKVKEVIASTTVRVNLGEYQSRDFFSSMRGELDEGEKPLDAARKLSRLADRAVANSIAAFNKARGKKMGKQALATRYGFIFTAEEGK